jgi:hypothetical protein
MNLFQFISGWRLAAGNWRLATGNWQLAAGNWLRATGGWQVRGKKLEWISY